MRIGQDVRSASSFPARLDAVELMGALPADAKAELRSRLRRGMARSEYIMIIVRETWKKLNVIDEKKGYSVGME